MKDVVAKGGLGSLLLTFIFAISVFLYAPSVEAKNPGYGEPLDLPNATTAADPAVIRVNGVYYLYPTTDSASIRCWSSADFVNWNYEGEVWHSGGPGSWNEGLACAPDVLPYEGRYYLYYAAGSKIGHIGVAVSDSPTGPFIDVYDHPFIGGGYGGTLLYSIDPHVFLDDDGSLYMYCSCLSPFSSVRVSRMADPITLTGEWEVLLRPGITNWEGILCEAPWMIKHDGTYYLMYSGNAATVPDYAIGYATSMNPMGPFIKYFGNPILDTDWDYDFWGPGHNSAVKDENGKLWMFYHTKTSPDTGWDRRVRINQLAFDQYENLYVVLNDDDDTGDDDAADDDASDDDANHGGGVEANEIGCGC